VTPIGLLLAPAAHQPGAGLTWYDTSGNGANITLPASGVTWALPAAQFVAKGTLTNDNAAAGTVGEYVNSTVAVGSAVSLTTATPANVTSISLTPGDWDLRAIVYFHQGATTAASVYTASISTTTATLGANDGSTTNMPGATGNAVDWSAQVKTHRLSLAATTTVYLVGQSTFTTSTNAAYGNISARRVR
jgi:hypothetical protein